MDRGEILERAHEIVTKDRNKQYGEPEDVFEIIADFWNVYINYRIGEMPTLITKEDVGNMMALFKMARITNGGNEDSYIDAAGYIACAAECRPKYEE